MKEAHYKLADCYFGYLAERFPVMCASDEFHFLPRAQRASNYYDRMESLAAPAMEECISVLKSFKRDFKKRARKEKDLESRIDLELLQANASGILLELETHQIWRHNPLLYLKIAFIGLDHSLSKPFSNPKDRVKGTLSRLSSVSRLLKEGMDNIDGVAESHHNAASAMVEDCRDYLHQMAIILNRLGARAYDAYLKDALSGLDLFGRFLKSVHTLPDRKFSTSSIEQILNNHFLCPRGLDEVYEIAVEEWNDMLKRLEKLRLQIDSSKSWQDLYHSYMPQGLGESDIICLYRKEINRICRFFSAAGLCEDAYCKTVELVETPVYLRSVRSPASFAASLTADEKEKSLFYITTHVEGKTATRLLSRRFHREHKFLISHETVPGHHMLDSIRRRLENPVRRQVESALFYEGWASYAEWLLFEYEYLQSPMEYLVHYKRRLWRAARCRIDAGLPRGLLTENTAVCLLTTCGFSKQEAIRQIDRFRLNPGYQLCYYLGSYEFRMLKKAYSNRMDSNSFYKIVLSGGELPFHLIDQTLNARLFKRNTRG
ncbi:MAG: DUF885 family protein [Deltaproteobacteria bacterium]|nr:DUF885 family protein [Deltaproteobacteria bacterium]MBW2153497.1 DUF885 family protein [Deltaproteobacteria bacterium]